MRSRRFLSLTALLLTSAASTRAAEPAIRFSRAADGGWQVAGPGYTASVNAAGYLASWKVKGVEMVGEPFAYQPQAKLVADSAEPAGDTLKVHLKGSGEATLDYRFLPGGLTITPTWKGGGYGEFRFTASPALLGIELLNDKAVNAGDALRFVEHGETRGVPAVPSSRNQMVRFHFPGFGLRAYVQAWGAPFNYESAGSIRDRAWGRPLLEANRPFPIRFAVQPGANRASLPAVPFVPRAEKISSLYYADEPCTWSLDLGERKSYQYLLDAGVKQLDLTWRLTDVHDQAVAGGKGTVALDASGARSAVPITLKAPGTGYYQAIFTLTERSGKMLPSSFRTRFTMIRKVAGLTNRDDSLAGKGLSDYAIVAMIGVGGIRESHNIGGFFSPEAKQGPDWQKVEGAEPAVWMNVKQLDELFTGSQAEARRYGLNWFFQANSRPQYATPSVYEAMAYALVSRCKDRCRTWEVENEPNFGYSPENYVNQCLIPFAKGAKRADPTCTVLGPGCVSLGHTLRFMETIYRLKAGRYLDGVSTHTYPGPGESWEQHGNLQMLERLRKLMADNGDGAKLLWQTEQGYAWENAPKGQTARYAVRQFLQGWRLGIDPSRQYYFYPHSHGFESWYQAGGGEQGSNESWLPIAAAQHFLAENTAGMKYAGDLSSPYKGVFLSRFTGADEDVIAAWTYDFPITVILRTKGVKRVENWMGRPAGWVMLGLGDYGFSLSGEPIYIHLPKGEKAEVLSPAFGRNVASADTGAVASASSSDPKNPPSFANDGNWALWENALDLPGRTAWISGQKDPSPQSPDWLQVSFPMPRPINRVAALCHLPAVNPSPRDYQVQALVKGKWQSVASAKGAWNWSIYHQFPTVTASAIRLLVTALNDGWHGDRRWMPIVMGPKAANYTASKLMISELEAYGPAAPVALRAQLVPGEGSDGRIALTLANRQAQPFRGSIRVSRPAGWVSAQAETIPVAAGPNAEAPYEVVLAPEQEMSAGPNRVRFALRDAQGKTVDACGVVLDVPAPVELAPQLPRAMDESAQPLVAAVKNLANEPVSGTLSLRLSGKGVPAGAVAPVAFGPIAPGQSATVEFRVPGLKLVGATVQATYTARVNRVLVSTEQSLAARGWQVLGPFANEGGTQGFDRVYPPEKGIDLNASCPVEGNQSARWKPALANEAGFVDLAGLFQPNNNVCAYAVLYVKSPVARKTILSVGSDDGIKAWVNGKVAIANNASRGAAPDQDRAAVSLRAGWNEVLLKITQGGYGWGYYCDFLTPDGKPMADLEYGAKPGR